MLYWFTGAINPLGILGEHEKSLKRRRVTYKHFRYYFRKTIVSSNEQFLSTGTKTHSLFTNQNALSIQVAINACKLMTDVVKVLG